MDVPSTEIPLDPTDPVVGIVAVVLTTWLRNNAKKYGLPKSLQKYVASVAVLLVVFLRAITDTLMGLDLTWELFLRAVLVGGSTVYAHTQWRSMVKEVAADVTGTADLDKAPE